MTTPFQQQFDPNAVMPQNPNQLQPNAINPGAFSNTGAIQGVYGNQMPSTFNRSVGPTDQSIGQVPVAVQTGVAPQYQQPQAVPTTF